MASKISINLDTSKENYILTKCKQDDDLTLEALIYENGLALELSNKEIIIKALKADNTYINQSTEISKENNKITAELVRDFTRVPGTTKVEVLLIEGGKQNTTFSFYLEVAGSVTKGAVESSNTVTIIEELDKKVLEAGQVKAETELLIKTGGAATKGDIATVNSQLEQNAYELTILNYYKNNSINAGVYGLTRDGINDNSDLLQELCNKITNGEAESTTILFPKGNYRIDKEIIVGNYVNIICEQGCVFQLSNTSGYGFKFTGRHYVDGMRFNYPNQDMNGGNIIQYGGAIGSDGNVGYSVFKNINLGNSYVGIDFSNGIAGGVKIENVVGYPLYRGIIIDKAIDVLNIDRVHFNPNFFGNPNVKLKTYVWKNAIGVECRRYDFGNVNNVFCYGYLAPFRVGAGVGIGGACNNVKFTNWIADACQRICIFSGHDGGLVFENGTGYFYNPYTTEQSQAGITVETSSNVVAIVDGYVNGSSSTPYVQFVNNKILKTMYNGIQAKNPLIFIGNEIVNYGSAYDESSSAVIQGLELAQGSDYSIIADNTINGKNKAQNRCITITGTTNHEINNNSLVNFKSAPIYGYENTNTKINGIVVCTSGSRPTGYKLKGYKIFDTTLNKELIWNGSNWVQFDGSIIN